MQGAYNSVIIGCLLSAPWLPVARQWPVGPVARRIIDRCPQPSPPCLPTPIYDVMRFSLSKHLITLPCRIHWKHMLHVHSLYTSSPWLVLIRPFVYRPISSYFVPRQAISVTSLTWRSLDGGPKRPQLRECRRCCSIYICGTVSIWKRDCVRIIILGLRWPVKTTLAKYFKRSAHRLGVFQMCNAPRRTRECVNVLKDPDSVALGGPSGSWEHLHYRLPSSTSAARCSECARPAVSLSVRRWFPR